MRYFNLENDFRKKNWTVVNTWSCTHHAIWRRGHTVVNTWSCPPAAILSNLLIKDLEFIFSSFLNSMQNTSGGHDHVLTTVWPRLQIAWWVHDHVLTTAPDFTQKTFSRLISRLRFSNFCWFFPHGTDQRNGFPHRTCRSRSSKNQFFSIFWPPTYPNYRNRGLVWQIPKTSEKNIGKRVTRSIWRALFSRPRSPIRVIFSIGNPMDR